MLSMPSARLIRQGISAGTLTLSLLLSACGADSGPATAVPPLPSAPIPTPLAPTASVPPALTATAPGAAPTTGAADLTTIAQGLHLPRLDGVTLNVLAWPDIYPAELFTPFEKATGATIKRTPVSTTDELIAKLASAGETPYDIISASADSIRGDIDNGLVQPIDLAKIPHYAELVPRLTSLGMSHKNGQVYGVPMVWGYNALVYDNDVLKTPPTSWNVLWDPAYKGKIAIWDDVSFVLDTALMLGIGKQDPSEVFHMTDAELAQVKAKLLELKAQQPIYWENESELTDLFAKHKVVAALGWLDNAYSLQSSGRNIRATHPQEGAEFWVDHWMIPAASKQKDAAEELINFALDPQVQA